MEDPKMALKLPSLKDILKRGKELLDEALIPLRTHRARTKANAILANLDVEIMELRERAMQEAAKEDINLSNVLNLRNQARLKLDDKEELTKIISELFPE